MCSHIKALNDVGINSISCFETDGNGARSMTNSCDKEEMEKLLEALVKLLTLSEIHLEVKRGYLTMAVLKVSSVVSPCMSSRMLYVSIFLNSAAPLSNGRNLLNINVRVVNESKYGDQVLLVGGDR